MAKPLIVPPNLWHPSHAMTFINATIAASQRLFN